MSRLRNVAMGQGRLVLVAIGLLLSTAAQAVMHQKSVVYNDGDTELKGILYWDDAFEGKRPGILVAHEWWGLNDYAKLRAEMLAEMGFVAFAADLYGDGRITRHADEAKQWMQQIASNAESWQRRAALALDQLIAHEKTDTDRLGAIGYCFGGATVMQLAYTGADLDGVVSFHGSLPPATPDQAARIRGRVLVAHGDADSFVPAARVAAFKEGLRQADVDWEMNIYSRARHGFTNPYADGYGVEGMTYQEEADRRSWQRMLAFFDDLFTDPLWQ